MHKIIVAMILFFLPLNFLYAINEFVQRPDVQLFIQQMVQKHHFDKKQLINLFSQVKIKPQVMASLNKPLEKKPWHYYQMLFVSEWRIKHGVEFWKKNAVTLQKAEKIYGVPAHVIVATIGIETKYGERIGDFRVIDSLSNIAFSNSRRAAFFRKELEEYLLLTREQHLNPLTIVGSYAGAIGQPQFMPSSYRYYAVNFSKSGKIDLIHNQMDVIGSVANYYKKNGWQQNGRIVEPALIIGNRYTYLAKKSQLQKSLTIVELTKLGVVPKNKIKEDQLSVKVIELDERYGKEYWLGFHNFDVLKRYNASDVYAMAVYQLSNHIADQWKQEQHG